MVLDSKKSDYVACKQQSHRPACASSQYGQPFFILFMESIVVSLAPFKNFNVQLVSVAEKTGLSLTLLETPKAGRLT